MESGASTQSGNETVIRVVLEFTGNEPASDEPLKVEGMRAWADATLRATKSFTGIDGKVIEVTSVTA